MGFFKRLTKRQYLIGAVLLFFMALALALRAIPALFIHDAVFLYLHDTDSYYTLRQIEVMVNHFPQYNWFDPMTAFRREKPSTGVRLFPSLQQPFVS
ncbi:MAG: STT3 domain-containing protein [Methanoregula sp.]|jgi:dolichyl-diphosphooligosaccharide--protein glycosyltransferase